MLWKLLNGGAVILGGGGFFYMLSSIDVSQNTTFAVPFILSIMLMVWGSMALFLQIIYFFSKLTSRKTGRAQRQALFISLLIGMHLSLQALLVWNVFTAFLISFIFVATEYFLHTHESQLST